MSIVFLPTLVHSQIQDTIVRAADTPLIEYQNKMDSSLRSSKNVKIDSLNNINKAINAKIQNTKNRELKRLSQLDTLQPQRRSSRKLDSARAKLTVKMDSLNDQGPVGELNQKLDSLTRYKRIDKLAKIDGKIAQTQNDINARLNEPASKVNDKLNQLSKESEGYGNLPSDMGAPTIDPDLRDAPGLDVTSPAIPNETIANPLDNLDLEEHTNINDNIGEIADINEVTGGLDKVSDVSQDISTYAADAKNISSVNLNDVEQIDKDVIFKLPNEELKAAQGELSAADSQIEALQALKNKEAFKRQTLEKAREVIVQQLALHQSKVMESVNKVSQHQKRAGTIFGKVKGLPKRAGKEKKPPVIERIVPGLTIQLQKTDNWYVDLNPSVGYRIRSVFSVGAGWNERIVSDNDLEFYKQSRMYGFRTFYELSVLKGLCVRADVERMNAFVPLNRSQQDIGKRKYVWSYMMGLKKEFSFGQGITGNVQFMYNLFDPKRTSPYFNKFNVRFGFEFPMKKKLSKKS